MRGEGQGSGGWGQQVLTGGCERSDVFMITLARVSETEPWEGAEPWEDEVGVRGMGWALGEEPVQGEE